MIEPEGKEASDVTVWFDDSGKQALAADSVIMRMVAEGSSSSVLAVDLRGQGESSPA